MRSRMSPRCRQLSWDNRRSAFGVTGRDEDLVVRQVASGEPEDTRGQPLGREIWWGGEARAPRCGEEVKSVLF